MSRSNHYQPAFDFLTMKAGDYRRVINPAPRLILGRRPFNRTLGYASWRDPHGRHPSWQAKLWRKEHRNKANRALRNCRDWDALQIQTKINRSTNAYDWY